MLIVLSQNGYRLCGSRTRSTETTTALLSVVREADALAINLFARTCGRSTGGGHCPSYRPDMTDGVGAGRSSQPVLASDAELPLRLGMGIGPEGGGVRTEFGGRLRIQFRNQPLR